jgi:uncharacterized membrane protein YgcG
MDATDKLNVYYRPTIDVEMLVHSLSDGTEQPLSIDSYVGCRTDKDGNTIIRYYTGWDDNPYDGFAIQESPELVEEIAQAARKIQREGYNNTVCVSKKWVEKFENIPVPTNDMGNFDYYNIDSLDHLSDSVYIPSSSSSGSSGCGGGCSSCGGGCSSCGGGGSW